MIAYEMACQLKEAGEDMGSLILIDSYIMNSDYDRHLVTIAFDETLPWLGGSQHIGNVACYTWFFGYTDYHWW